MMQATTAAPNKSMEAYHRLRDLIEAGQFSNGERLSESKAVRMLGLGRGPVRDSLLRLEAEGRLETRGKRRSRVIVYAEEEKRDELLFRYELREQIESGAARLAAKNMNGWQIDHLRTLAERIEKFARSGEAEARYDANLEFHRYLMANCGNPLLLEVWETYRLSPTRPRTIQFEQEILSKIPKPERDRPTLVDMVDAIATHDQDRAEQFVEQRIRIITEAIRKTFWEPAKRGRGVSRQASNRASENLSGQEWANGSK